MEGQSEGPLGLEGEDDEVEGEEQGASGEWGGREGIGRRCRFSKGPGLERRREQDWISTPA